MRFDFSSIKVRDEDVEKYKGKTVAFVHAKGSSERVPSKNLRLLGDIPLFCHAIKNALGSERVDLVVIDSDSDEILRIGQEHGAVALKRPRELATNLATGDDLAYWQASNYPSSNVVLQVIPTAPFITSASIDKAIQFLLDNPDTDSVAGVHEDVFYTWKDGRPAYYKADGTIPNSVDLPKVVYETTGLYINRTAAVLKTGRRLNPSSCKPYVLSKLESVDINTIEDFEFAEMLLAGQRLLSSSSDK